MPTPSTPRASDFIAAARQLECAIRDAFVDQSQLIKAASNLIHAIQSERGASNLYVANNSEQHCHLREAMIAETGHFTLGFMRALPSPAHVERSQLSHRLLLQLAAALESLENLIVIREQINRRQLSTAEVIHRYSRIVHTLLCVVFEIADIAAEPAMARTLIALVNIMQCKELSGQERATGTGAFAGSSISAAQSRQWQHLIEAQEKTLEVFAGFADLHAQQLCEQISQLPDYGKFESLRRQACTSHSDTHFAEHTGERWFQLASQRMNALKEIEDYLIEVLQQQCTHVPDAQSLPSADAHNSFFVVMGTTVDVLPHEDKQPVRHYHDDAISPHIGRTMIEMLYQQACRLQETESELATTKNALVEGKRIAKAKAVLIRQRNITEDQAHRLLQQIAMKQSRSISEVASFLLAMEEH